MYSPSPGVIIIFIIIIIIITLLLYKKKVLLRQFYWVTFKLEDIHRPIFCATTFFICHYTDFGNG